MFEKEYSKGQIESLIDNELLEEYRSLLSIPLSDELLPQIRNLATQNVLIGGYNDVSVEKLEISSEESGREITVFKCSRGDVSEKSPAFLLVHGGGYILGSVKSGLEEAKRLADLTSFPVYSVEYRLAPEYPYPAGLHDCYDVLVYLSENAEELGIDCERIAIYGGSAGGGMCACLALYARDMKGPDIALQVLLYPMLDDRQKQPSTYQLARLRSWNRQQNTYAWKSYLKGLYETDDVPYTAAPSRCSDLSGLPPAFITVGMADLFRDEDIEYAAQLAKDGVQTELYMVPGLYHASENSDSRASRRMYQAIQKYIRDFFELD